MSTSTVCWRLRAGQCAADFDGSGMVEAGDIFEFLNLWFANFNMEC